MLYDEDRSQLESKKKKKKCLMNQCALHKGHLSDSEKAAEICSDF